MDTPKLSRRKFLKIAGVAGALAIPALTGFELLREAQGESLPSLSPYAPIEMLEKWPTNSEAASPILLLINKNSDNPFGLYLTEILRAEGLNCFQVADVSDLDRAPLNWYDLILLAEGSLDQTRVELLEKFVTKGGNLVAMRPDARLASLMGLELSPGSTAEGYLQVEGRHPVGQGIATETLQFHGVADQYRLAGAEVIAWLASTIATKTNFPAVTIHRFGQGQAAAWSFDLARSIAYTRQGNPVWANQERDEGDGIRAADMFKDWIDLDRLAIAQADQQQRLLVNLLSALSQDTRPLPRLWYFPGAAETMLIATGDSHGNPASAIEDVLTRIEQRGGHYSIYYTAFPSDEWRRATKNVMYQATDIPLVENISAGWLTAPKPSLIAAWRARGHEFSLHPYVEQGLEAGWRQYFTEYTGLGYGPMPQTARTHRILWTGWVETARVQASHGIKMNFDYYHWGPLFQNEAGEWLNGYLTGSGLPMKFVDEQGRILSVYQQLTHMADDHLLNLHWGGVAKISAEAALEVSQTLLQRSLAGEYSAITGHFHVDPFAIGGEWISEAIHWLEGTLDYAVARGIPIWSAEEWLHFTEIRHEANLKDIEWHPPAGSLRFELAAADRPDVSLTIMVPLQHGGRSLTQVQVDGLTIEHRERKLGGVSYGWISVPSSSHYVTATYV